MLLEEETMLVYHLIKIFVQRMFTMTSTINLLDISVVNAVDLEQMWLLVIEAVDDLEQVARARELTNVIWDVNTTSSEEGWEKTEILLESYERTRDESLESALSNLKELMKIMNESKLSDRRHSIHNS